MLDLKRSLSALVFAGATGLSILSTLTAAGTASADSCGAGVDRNSYFDGQRVSAFDISEEQLANANEPEFQRSSYFDGKFLSASDLTSEQTCLIEFEQGDVRQPYVIGQMYSGNDAPPEQSCEDAAGPVRFQLKDDSNAVRMYCFSCP
jgi:hypothetical protein